MSAGHIAGSAIGAVAAAGILAPPVVGAARKQATLDGVDRAKVVLGTLVGTGVAGLLGASLLSLGPEPGRAAGVGLGLARGAGGAMLAVLGVSLIGATLISADALKGAFTGG